MAEWVQSGRPCKGMRSKEHPKYEGFAFGNEKLPSQPYPGQDQRNPGIPDWGLVQGDAGGYAGAHTAVFPESNHWTAEWKVSKKEET